MPVEDGVDAEFDPAEVELAGSDPAESEPSEDDPAKWNATMAIASTMTAINAALAAHS
ncbi:MAG: hypothetical protein WCB53_05800 [Terriglobales bacterium]